MNVPRLFTPGPTPVPEYVREAESRPMIHHRSEEFSGILADVRRSLRELSDTDGEVLLLSSSGTGGMEAAVASLFAEGDEVVVVEGGKFGARWVELARHYGLDARIIRVERGRSVSPEEVLRSVTPATKGILCQACESSTGAYHPVDRIGPLLEERGDLLFVVDAITALGVHDISMKRDRIDVLICASQKALMSPPGLASVSLSPRAIACLSSSASRSFYFSLRRELAAQMKGQTGFTPAISLVRAVDTALKGILSVPREARLKRQKRLQRMAREALREDGLTLFNRDEEAAWGITVAEAPAGVQAKAWIQDLKLKSGLWLAGGQGELEGKIFRLAHLGAIGPEDLLWAIETIEKSVAAHYPNAGRHAGLIRARKIMEAG